MIDIEKEREVFEEVFPCPTGTVPNEYYHYESQINPQDAMIQSISWVVWLACTQAKQAEINDLKAQLERAKKDSKRIDFLSDKSQSVANVMLPTKIVERNLSSLRNAIDQAMEIGND